MSQIEIDIPDDALSSMNLPEDELAGELRMLAAVKLFELGRLSSGAAAALAGVPKPVFLNKLGDYGVTTFRQTEQELLEDMNHA